MTKSTLQETILSVGNLPKEKFDELESYIDNLKTTRGSLIQILHKAQGIFGYLPRDVQMFIVKKLDIPSSEVFGVVSFYSFFSTKPSGRHTISVCMGTACFIKGADKILKRLKEMLDIETNQTTADGLFTLKDVRCIGTCGLAPVMKIDDKVYGSVKVEDLENILNTYRKEEAVSK